MVVDLFDDGDWDVEQEQPGFRWKRRRIGRRLGADLLGLSTYLLPAGERTFPYHLHHGNEELLVVLAGTVSVRTPDGERRLSEGQAMVFRRGPAGAHEVINCGEGDARLIIVSTMVEPDITEFPETGKVGLFAGAAPGATAEGALQRFLSMRAEVGYFDDEPA